MPTGYSFFFCFYYLKMIKYLNVLEVELGTQLQTGIIRPHNQ